MVAVDHGNIVLSPIFDKRSPVAEGKGRPKEAVEEREYGEKSHGEVVFATADAPAFRPAIWAMQKTISGWEQSACTTIIVHAHSPLQLH